ncbi:hypothetical protein L596_018707 [Steinernema carpocapsae]|uniref:RING-type domain-containing protein n=1 Tax=Steinernema carpocapsae TaxID=34508 RepID=A0A4V6A248_STECR|nr:hypothetical protein L596_018707 [Steinernema carpocapsae]
MFSCVRSMSDGSYRNKYETLVEQTFTCQRCLRRTRHSKRLRCGHSICFDCVYESLDLRLCFLTFVKCPLCFKTTYRSPATLKDSYAEADFEDAWDLLQAEENNRQYLEQRRDSERNGSDFAWDFSGMLDDDEAGFNGTPQKKKTIVAVYIESHRNVSL